MDITGKVVQVLEVESGTSKAGNPWKKQNFVIETSGQYPKKVCLQLFGENVNSCPSVGDEVKVSFDAESSEWQGRWFTQLNAWKVEKQGTQATQTQTQTQAQPQPVPQPQPQQTSWDKMPF